MKKISVYENLAQAKVEAAKLSKGQKRVRKVYRFDYNGKTKYIIAQSEVLARARIYPILRDELKFKVREVKPVKCPDQADVAQMSQAQLNELKRIIQAQEQLNGKVG